MTPYTSIEAWIAQTFVDICIAVAIFCVDSLPWHPTALITGPIQVCRGPGAGVRVVRQNVVRAESVCVARGTPAPVVIHRYAGATFAARLIFVIRVGADRAIEARATGTLVLITVTVLPVPTCV
eukprot:SAG22_NODE_9232_length_601_cov_1.701195_1_plen_123_part_01